MVKRLVVQLIVLALVAVAFVSGPLKIRSGSSDVSVQAAPAGGALGFGARDGRLGRAAELTGGGANFVSVCRYSHTSQDDPIVFPGISGATHHHDFFANVSTKADSTYDSLQDARSLCRIDGDTAAYWTPSLYDSGERVEPTGVRVYYTPGRKNHLSIRPFPAGLKVVAKENNVKATWACVGPGRVGRGSEDVPTCPQGSHLVLRHRFPDCWNGRDLDVADHTSHMAFSMRGACPSSHDVPVPALSVNVHYPTDGGDVVLGMPDMPVPPHADFFNAWDQPTLERLVRVCLNAGLHCGARPPTGRTTT
jgi:hypothetical protein